MAPDYIIWKIDESEEELRAKLSHPEYFEEKISHLKPGSARMLEVLAVRNALKVLFHGEEQRVLYTEEGAPYLGGNDSSRGSGSYWVSEGSQPFISISHTKDYAAVITSDVPVGIDIERRSNRVQRVVSHFLKPEELATISLASTLSPLPEDTASLLALHLAWSAKEAAFKVLGRDYYDLQQLTTVQHIDWTMKTLTLAVANHTVPLQIHFDYTDDYVLAWVQSCH